MLRIDADLLVPGRGEPVSGGTVVTDGPVITFAGPTADAPDTPDAEVVRAPTVLPGLWDCHTHLVGATSFDLHKVKMSPVAMRAARAAGDLRRALDSGITSIRDAGGFAVDVAPAVLDGTVVGPTIHAAGAILTTTGGHGDLHGFPVDVVHGLSATGGMSRLCDGPDECAKAVREQLRRGAAVIKICASGGVLSERDDPKHQEFTHDELRRIVEVAELSERVVMAHCHGKPGMLAAIEAGVKTIEHGTYLDDEVTAAMVEHDVLLVTTRMIVTELREVGLAAGMSPASFAKLEFAADTHMEAIGRAHEAGVRIAMGTDCAMSDPALPAAWGNQTRELALLAEVGMSPLAVIEASTANGPDTLGPQAPLSGQLREGYDADVIVVDGDPTADVKVLTEPSNVTHVIARGALVKAPAPA
jgi:imidazolonepropionase-like amidohydrolase